MNSDLSKLHSSLAWLLLVIAAIGLTAYITSLGSRGRELAQHTAQLEQKANKLQALTRRKDAAVFEARYCMTDKGHKDGKLREMMRKSTSRESFVVREGPRIAWCELAGKSKIGFYLPEGGHWLHYELVEGWPNDAPRRQTEIVGSALNEFSASCKLGPQPDVYEIQFWSNSSGKPPRIAVLGKENAIIHESELPRLDGTSVVSVAAAKDGFAYPSEVKIDANEPRDSHEFLSPPLVEIGRLDVFQGGGKLPWQLRFWVESDSPPCVAAIEAAAHYEAVTRWQKPLRYNCLLLPDWAEREAIFSRTFKPYDGSDRLYFRNDFFHAR